MSNIHTLCVYCGSRTGDNPLYLQIAKKLADYLVEHDIELINGGGSIGLMGVMADRMLERGGKCTGVIPLSLRKKEVAHFGMTELITVPDMHARKLTMVNLSDAFLSLPGGFGTLDETFETLTWSQLHLHQKPIALLNLNGFFDPLLAMADSMVAEGFLKEDARALLQSAYTVEEAMSLLDAKVPATGLKWS